MARTAVGSLVVLLVHVETRLQTNITNATAAAETLNACSEKFAEMQNNTPWMQSLREEQAELDASKEKLSSMQMRLEDARAKYQHSLELRELIVGLIDCLQLLVTFSQALPESEAHYLDTRDDQRGENYSEVREEVGASARLQPEGGVYASLVLLHISYF